MKKLRFKEKFIASTIILIVGGAITKFLGMFIRVVMTRLVGLEGIGLYMLVYPTFSLFMTLSQLSMPTAISKLVSEDRHNNKRIVFSAIPVTLIFNLFLIVIIVLFAPFIANTFLKEPNAYLPILAIALVLPFDSISNLLRGYFFGKQKMFPHVISHICEQIIRLIIIILIIPYLLTLGVTYAVCGLILVNMASEFLSIGILFLFLPKNFKITKQDLIPQKQNIKDVLDISIPTTGGRLIGSIGYFLEPILLTSCLLAAGYSNSYILTEYGIVSGYVMPLLLMPGFFTNAISSALLPVISNAYAHDRKEYVKKKLKQAIFISLAIAIPYTLILMWCPEFFLKLFYNTNHGGTYLRTIAPIFLFYYIQSPIAIALQSLNLSKNLFWDNLKGIVTKCLAIVIFSFFHIGMFPLLIAIACSVIVTTTSHYFHLRKKLQT